mgnify:CR=1 FL=1
MINYIGRNKLAQNTLFSQHFTNWTNKLCLKNGNDTLKSETIWSYKNKEKSLYQNSDMVSLSVSIRVGQLMLGIFQHFRTFSNTWHKSYRSELRQYSIKMGRGRSVCGIWWVDGAMMSVRVAMHWDAHKTDRCGLMCDAVASMLRHGGSQRVRHVNGCHLRWFKIVWFQV